MVRFVFAKIINGILIMRTQPKELAQKVLEYQETAQVMRAAEQARRTTIFFFGVTLPVILGYILSQAASTDTNAYLSLRGFMLTLMSLI